MLQRVVFYLSCDSDLITPLFGDTLFGRVCLEIKHSFGEDRLLSLLAEYSSSPFAVFSSAFPQIESSLLVPYPKASSIINLSNINSNQNFDSVCQIKKNKWLILDDDFSIKSLQFSICENQFTNLWFCSILDTNQISIEEIFQIVKQLGISGFGKRSSLGFGRFSVTNTIVNQVNLTNYTSEFDGVITLSPHIVNDYGGLGELFIRFGKAYNSDETFKSPYLMLHHGSIFPIVNNHFNTIIGKSESYEPYNNETNNSETSKYKFVNQGYTPVIAIKDPEYKNYLIASGIIR
jgi:CRISPR-associated protein Csm4